jgi:hypothetical protein
VSDDDVGEVSFVGSSGFASGLAFGSLAFDVVTGGWMASLLGDADDVQDAIDAPVAAQVQTVPDRCCGAFAGGQRHGSCSAPAGEPGFGGEPVRVADFDEQGRRDDGADAGFVAQGGAVLVEELVEVTFQAANLP